MKDNILERSINRDSISFFMTNNWWKGMPKEIELDLESLSEFNVE